jgi:hypothetical protein
MDDEELRSAHKLFADIFKAAASDVSGLYEVAQRILDDSIDMRPVLRVAEDTSGHTDSKKYASTLRFRYDNVVDALGESAARIRNLIEHFTRSRYGERLQEARTAIGDTPPPRAILDEMVRMACELQAGMTTRHSQWAAFLLNFANLVRSVDGAHSVILKRPTRLEKYKDLRKAGASFMAGRIFTGFGLIVAIAKSQGGA